MAVGICQCCGKTFGYPKSQRNRKYCSHACSHQVIGMARRKRKLVICKTCGKLFETTQSSNPKYCSIACRASGKDQTGANNPMWKGGRIIRKCENCGEEFSTYPCEIKKGGGKYCSRKCRGEGQSEYQAGKNNPMWKGGVTPETMLIRMGKKYEEWRESVLARDNWTCQDCGDRTYKGRGQRVILHAHHVFPFSEFPEHRLEPWNGVTLCFNCHLKIHPNLKGLSRDVNHTSKGQNV